MYNENDSLPRIARHLIMNASFISDLGLYHGKMGIVLFFSHYARYTGNSLYDEFSGELLDDVYEEIHTGLPVNFEYGLCGIGWGIEYMLKNGFIAGDSDEILAELDNKVMERDLRRITDRSLRTGFEGISTYICTRINSSSRKSGSLPFDNTYLTNWKSVTPTIAISDDEAIWKNIVNTLPEGEDITLWRLGLENGCAGVGINIIRQ